jgi:hypothetical protein
MAMSVKGITSALTVGLLVILTTGCQTNLFSKSPDDKDYGVPLTEFYAKDRSYFPGFIRKFFPGVAKFEAENPALGQARADVVMIEVKPLNDGMVKTNEANLSWSADGVYLGFEQLEDGFRKIMLKDLDGNFARELKVIPKGPNNFLDGMVVKSAHSYNAGLRWSRDSTRYAFMSNGGVGEYNIYVGAVGAPEKSIASSPTKDGYAVWSPVTNEISFVSARTGNGDIYLIDLKTKKIDRLSASDGVDIFPEWFPNGNRIVYSSGDALNHDLYVVNRSKRNSEWERPHQLTSWDRDDLRPTISPDGRYVAFYADSGEVLDGGVRKWNIMVVPYVPGKTYAETELRNMVVARDVVIDLNTGPAWSPDSRKIFYVKRDPSVANPIYAYDLFTGRDYLFKTNTRMNRDILLSKLGILSFRAQVGVWDRVFVALTNQGMQLQEPNRLQTKIHYHKM